MESETIAPKYKTTTITLPEELSRRLAVEAARQERSRSWISARAIREYLERREAPEPQTGEG